MWSLLVIFSVTVIKIIAAETVPTCGINEEYSTCTQAVCRNQNCTDVGNPVACPLIVEGYCIKGCVCKENYYRNSNGICVSKSECNSCPEGEVFSTNAPPQCDADYCPKSRESPQSCPTTDATESRCTCGFDRKRDRDTKKCIATSSCPPFPCEGPNEEYNSCPPVCPGQNCSDFINNSTCPKYKIGIVVPCKPQCRCRENYYRNSKGVCVSGKQCKRAASKTTTTTTTASDQTTTAILPSGEKDSCNGDPNAVPGCGINCGKLCSDIESVERGTFKPRFCVHICLKNACDCKNGFFYNSNLKKCVSKDQCNASKTTTTTTTAMPPSDEEDASKTTTLTTTASEQTTTATLPSGEKDSCNGDPNAVPGCGINCGKLCSDIESVERGTFKPEFCIHICLKNACDCKNGFFYNSNLKKCVTKDQCNASTNNTTIITPMSSTITPTSSTIAPTSSTSTEASSKTDTTKIIQRFKQGINNFTMKFLKTVCQTTNDSMIMSPFSVEVPLAELALYSTGNTYDEIMSILNLQSKDEVREAFKTYLKSIKEPEDVELKLAAKVYVNDKYTLSEEFEQDTGLYFNSTAENFDGSNVQKAADNMNDWVKANTGDKIKDLVSPGMITEETKIVLLNAIYFKGDWKFKFDVKKTQEKDFYLDKDTVIQTQMMYQKSKLNFYESNELNARIIELPYQNENYKMRAFLPFNKEGLNDLIEKMQDVNIVDAAITNLHTETVIVWFPLIDVKTRIDLSNILKQIGVKSLFNQNNADIKGILKNYETINVSAAIQEAAIKVDENGSVAAAANAFIARTTSIVLDDQSEFIADHPFLYCIYNNNDALFCGVFRK